LLLDEREEVFSFLLFLLKDEYKDDFLIFLLLLSLFLFLKEKLKNPLDQHKK